MKVLESRHMMSDVTLMTWSPKMDILAIANSKPEVILHRLTWQKVWTLGNNFGRTGMLETPAPKSLTFHPEGLYLAIGFEDGVTLVEVESGNIITRHEVSPLTAVKWKSTNYAHSLKDVFSTESERLESHLSILLLGTQTGQVHIYSGAGLLYTVTLTLTNPFPISVLDIEIPSDFSSVQVVASNRYDSPTGNVLSLYFFDCNEYAFHGDVLGVFAAKAIAYKRYLNAIEVEVASVHENWGIIVEVYKHYLSYATGNVNESIKADYAELLMTGVCSPELEMFLGSGGREKEAKKFINTLQGASTSLNDALKNIKCNIVSLLRELADITGYHSFLQITNPPPNTNGSQTEDKDSEGTKIIQQLKELLSVLYHGAVHAQHAAETFLSAFYNFITLLLNSIHSFSVLESPEPPEEEAEPERVFDFLRFKITRYIFEMLELNPEDPESEPKSLIPEALMVETTESSFGIIPQVLRDAIPKMTTEELHKFYSGPSIIDIDEISRSAAGDDGYVESKEWPRLSKFLKDNGFEMKPKVLNSSNSQLQRMLMSFTQLAEEQLQALLKVPVLDSEVTKKNFVVNYYDNGSLENDSFGILTDSKVLSTTHFYHKEGGQGAGSRLWLYKIENLETNGAPCNPVLTAALLLFEQQALAADFLNNSVFSILCYLPHAQSRNRRRSAQDEFYEAMDTSGNSALCHLDLSDIFQNLGSRPLRIPKGTSALANKWTEINVSIPTDITVPGPIEHDQIAQILPIPNFHPTLMALSGPRRVGALLDQSKRVVQLLDMDLESSETSIDLDTTVGSTSSTVTEDVRDLTID